MKANVNPVDGLGEIKARIADLKEQAAIFHAQIVALGTGAHEGALFRATVTESERTKYDMDAIRAKLSPQFLAAHSEKFDVVTVRVSARNGKEA